MCLRGKMISKQNFALLAADGRVEFRLTNDFVCGGRRRVGGVLGVLLKGCFRALFCFSFLLSILEAQAAAPGPLASGELTNLEILIKLGTSPGTDTLDVDGSWVPGSGHNGINPISESVVFSFDNGRFLQAFGPESFTAISGGYRYLAPAGTSGITQLRIMNNGTFLVDVRKADLSGLRTTALGAMSITVGDDIFTATPNSVPVGKISGTGEADVGELVTFDASQSSDFNMQSLSYTWSIVSQPQGSSVSLSSLNNPTTSFTGTHRGAYVLKLVPNDGIEDGIPAVFTVQVDGGPEDPVPPPTHENGIITLSTNQPGYQVGEAAVLTVHEDIQAGNGTNRYFFRATWNDVPIPLTVVPGSNVDNIYTTPAFTEAMTHTFKVDLYIENANLAVRLVQAIESFTQDIAAVEAALVHETDSEAISRLNAQKAYDLEQIAIAQEQQELNRTRIGATTLLEFIVSEAQ